MTAILQESVIDCHDPAVLSVFWARRLGASLIHPFQAEGNSGFVVLQDPEGNEFCFVTDPTGSWAAFLANTLHDLDDLT